MCVGTKYISTALQSLRSDNNVGSCGKKNEQQHRAERAALEDGIQLESVNFVRITEWGKIYSCGQRRSQPQRQKADKATR